MEQAQVYCLNEARFTSQQKKLKDDYRDYLKMLDAHELENEITFLLEQHSKDMIDASRLAMRSKVIMKELASRIDSPTLENKVNHMSEEIQNELT